LLIVGIGLIALYGTATGSYQWVTPEPEAVLVPDFHTASAAAPTTVPILPAPSVTSTARTPSADQAPEVADLAAMNAIFEDVSFDLTQIRAADGPVPRLFLNTLPSGFSKSMPVAERKNHFLRIVLPIVLAVNEEIRTDRGRIIALQRRVADGIDIGEDSRVWLADISRRHKLAPVESESDFSDLLTRVDAISVSVALAQAIEESGWGRSRFVRDGNALFGQRTWTAGAGIIPVSRAEGQSFEVKTFSTLRDSVRRYAHNINSHRAYADYRKIRRDSRAAGQPLNGHALTSGLTRYSERGQDYIDALRGLIRTNRLYQLEDAILVEAGEEA
jgi:Bax protein